MYVSSTGIKTNESSTVFVGEGVIVGLIVGYGDGAMVGLVFIVSLVGAGVTTGDFVGKAEGGGATGKRVG